MGQNGLVTFPLVGQKSRPGLTHAHPVPPAMDCELEHTLTIGEGKASAAQPKGFPQLFPVQVRPPTWAEVTYPEFPRQISRIHSSSGPEKSTSPGQAAWAAS